MKRPARRSNTGNFKKSDVLSSPTPSASKFSRFKKQNSLSGKEVKKEIISDAEEKIKTYSILSQAGLDDNGKTKKTSEFTPTEVKHYAFQTSEEQTTPYLYHIDIDSKEGIKLNNIAKDIVEAINNNEIITSPGKLFLIDGSYFFTAFIKKGEQYKVALLEYINDDNTIIEIATFKGDISHVEPYQ